MTVLFSFSVLPEFSTVSICQFYNQKKNKAIFKVGAHVLGTDLGSEDIWMNITDKPLPRALTVQCSVLKKLLSLILEKGSLVSFSF